MFFVLPKETANLRQFRFILHYKKNFIKTVLTVVRINLILDSLDVEKKNKRMHFFTSLLLSFKTENNL